MAQSAATFDKRSVKFYAEIAFACAEDGFEENCEAERLEIALSMFADGNNIEKIARNISLQK